MWALMASLLRTTCDRPGARRGLPLRSGEVRWERWAADSSGSILTAHEQGPKEGWLFFWFPVCGPTAFRAAQPAGPLSARQ